MRRNGFTLIELAISLTIMGLILGGSFQAIKSMRERTKVSEAKDDILTAKNAVIGDAISYNSLANSNEFTNNLSPIKNSKIPLFYIADDRLINTLDLCSFGNTEINVTLYENNVLTKTVENVAFVIASRGPNNNMQTNVTGASPSFIVRVDDPSYEGDRNSSDYTRISDKYDDVVTWVTLGELKSILKCTQPRILNTSLPDDTNNSTSYSAKIYFEGNASAPSGTGCIISNSAYKYTNLTYTIEDNGASYPASSGVAHVRCNYTVDGYNIKKEFTITIHAR